MKRPLYVFGASRYAQLVADYFEGAAGFEVKGFTVDEQYLTSKRQGEYPVVPFEALIEKSRLDFSVFLAVGYRRMRDRGRVHARLRELGVAMPNFVSPRSHVATDVSLGSNNIIMPGAVVEQGVSLGDNNVVWSNVTICHDAHVGDHNFVAANATIGGFAKLGSGCFLGFSATIEQHRSIGDETLVAAMTYIRSDTAAYSRYQGVPGRQVSMHPDNGIEITDP